MTGTAGGLPLCSGVPHHTLPFSLVAALALGGCQGPTPAEKAAQDARDVAQVEAAQKIQPPVQPIAPEPLTEPDFARAEAIARPADAVSRLPDDHPDSRPAHEGCVFRAEGATAPIFTVDAKRAMLKLSGELVVLAIDSGSSEVAPGFRAKYIGKEHWAQLAGGSTAGKGTLTLRDRYDRVVYAAPGTFTCAR